MVPGTACAECPRSSSRPKSPLLDSTRSTIESVFSGARTLLRVYPDYTSTISHPNQSFLLTPLSVRCRTNFLDTCAMRDKGKHPHLNRSRLHGNQRGGKPTNCQTIYCHILAAPAENSRQLQPSETETLPAPDEIFVRRTSDFRWPLA